MKCPYCGRRMFKDEDSGIKRCWSCEAKQGKDHFADVSKMIKQKDVK